MCEGEVTQVVNCHHGGFCDWWWRWSKKEEEREAVGLQLSVWSGLWNLIGGGCGSRLSFLMSFSFWCRTLRMLLFINNCMAGSGVCSCILFCDINLWYNSVMLLGVSCDDAR